MLVRQGLWLHLQCPFRPPVFMRGMRVEGAPVRLCTIPSGAPEYVRPFQVAHDQAQEGRRGRQARQDLHAHHQGTDRRGPRRRRRSRTCNPRLRTIIADAKAANMPAENIKRAIRRGTGEEPGVSYEEAQYEGYGPGGAAVIIDVLTDNKNRTVGELRHLLDEARRQPRRDATPSPGCSASAATSSSRRARPTRKR